MADLAGRDTGAADQQRHPQRGVVREHLARPDPVLAEEVAVVRREHHVGPSELAGALELPHDLVDRQVGRRQGLQPLPVHLGHRGQLFSVRRRHVAQLLWHVGHVGVAPPGPGCRKDLVERVAGRLRRAAGDQVGHLTVVAGHRAGSRPASRGWPWWGAVNETWVKNGVVDAAWPRIIAEAMLP